MRTRIILPCLAFLSISLASCGQQANYSVTETSPQAQVAMASPASSSEASMPLSSVEFLEDHHNFGEVPEGDSVTHVFRFKNTGAHPLKVENVKPSCGCTSRAWSLDEIPAGGEGFVTLSFDSKGKVGVQKKSATVTFVNTDPKNRLLSFQAEVVAR